MYQIFFVCVFIISFIPSSFLLGQSLKSSRPTGASKILYVQEDYKNFYHFVNSKYLMMGLGLSALSAHSKLDTHFQGWFQRKVANQGFAGDLASSTKIFGERPWVLAYFGLSLFDTEKCSPALCKGVLNWADQSRRMVVVGLPLVWGLQYTLGARRPYQGGSKWTYFDDSHAVSGHAFIGAIPFLGVAGQVKNPYLKATLIGLSTLPAWSRVHDDQHYLSQSFMGWLIAWRAYEITKPDYDPNGWSLFSNGTHVGLAYRKQF